VNQTAALQAALAAEQATIYGYGVVGAKLIGDDTDRDYATAALATHVLLRDKLMAMITAIGAKPGAARAAYQLPFVVDDAATARQLAAHLEQGVSGAAWDLIAAAPSGSPVRADAIRWLADAAIRAAHWGASQPLPGQPA
jgi:Domain of unknown function (DUF4439)